MQPNTDFSKNSIHLGAYSQTSQDTGIIEEKKTHVDKKPSGSLDIHFSHIHLLLSLNNLTVVYVLEGKFRRVMLKKFANG
ncbi:hypothetical protein [Pseudobacteriovorax antillogorgiicola]|uniref:Uncharacterized protein n=1 Tax=Pseudobacteriovorax antillogorgiicola TaxID=1513793 RepID=A0A1Y6C8Y2_9BACT|nr:hypothetical protein [Pseudobacteriovorax antillogorgiicola]SMF49820.1 hypothetical protein SAMN06296036_115120 [Pseudobacteriovorax antillogorgiicola]